MKFHEAVHVQKGSSCSTCKTFLYGLPLPVDAPLVYLLERFAPPTYPIDKFKVLFIASPMFELRGTMGQKELRVKYIGNYEANSAAFRATIAEWLNNSGFQVEF